MTNVYYLAYGSNLSTPRLRRRVPSARALGRIELPGWDLCFHKRSWLDGSGKCDIVRAPSGVVQGVIWELAAEDRVGLDTAEGLGNGYEELRLRLPLNGDELTVFTYVAAESHVDPSLAPFRWYLEFVVAGAREHGFPPDYVDRLSAVAAIDDPDRARAARERRVLG